MSAAADEIDYDEEVASRRTTGERDPDGPGRGVVVSRSDLYAAPATYEEDVSSAAGPGVTVVNLDQSDEEEEEEAPAAAQAPGTFVSPVLNAEQVVELLAAASRSSEDVDYRARLIRNGTNAVYPDVDLDGIPDDLLIGVTERARVSMASCLSDAESVRDFGQEPKAGRVAF